VQPDDRSQREHGSDRIRTHRAHLRAHEHTREPIFDYALVNTAPFSPETLARYAAEGATPIEADIARVEALGVHCIAGNFASEENVVRHAAGRVTAALLALGQTALTNRD
jgi:hypothetical protein